MEKEFIPYDLALTLKELGFDEPCFGFYTEEYKTLIKNFCKYPINLPTKPFLAPTFSQAFRWFREKNNFDLVWKPMSMVGITCYYDIEIHHPKYVWDKPPRVTGKTYEEAELECLKKLIEIVKNK